VNAIYHSVSYGAGAAVIALLAGYLATSIIFNRRKTPVLASFQDVVVSVPPGIPPVIFGLGLLLVFAYGPVRLYGTPWPIVILYATIILPFATRLQLVAMTGMGTNLMEAGAASGAGLFRRAFRIQLPLIRPAIGYTVALAFVLASVEFSGSLLLRTGNTQVMGTQLYDLYEFGSYPLTAVMAVIMCLVTGTGVSIAILIGGPGVLRQQVR